MRHVVVAVTCVTALAACTGGGDDVAGDGTPNPSPVAGEGAPPPAGAAPFDLRVERITVVGTGNAALLGVPGPPPSNEAAELAVDAARRALLTFLNAQLADEATRFSAGPVDRLLSAGARRVVTPEHRAGLGQVDLPIARTITGPAATVAQVLVDGTTAHAVTLTYTARLTVELADGQQAPVEQSGSMTFLPTPEGWRADAVQVTTELPEAAP